MMVRHWHMLSIRAHVLAGTNTCISRIQLAIRHQCFYLLDGKDVNHEQPTSLMAPLLVLLPDSVPVLKSLAMEDSTYQNRQPHLHSFQHLLRNVLCSSLFEPKMVSICTSWQVKTNSQK